MIGHVSARTLGRILSAKPEQAREAAANYDKGGISTAFKDFCELFFPLIAEIIYDSIHAKNAELKYTNLLPYLGQHLEQIEKIITDNQTGARKIIMGDFKITETPAGGQKTFALEEISTGDTVQLMIPSNRTLENIQEHLQKIWKNAEMEAGAIAMHRIVTDLKARPAVGQIDGKKVKIIVNDSYASWGNYLFQHDHDLTLQKIIPTEANLQEYKKFCELQAASDPEKSELYASLKLDLSDLYEGNLNAVKRRTEKDALVQANAKKLRKNADMAAGAMAMHRIVADFKAQPAGQIDGKKASITVHAKYAWGNYLFKHDNHYVTLQQNIPTEAKLQKYEKFCELQSLMLATSNPEKSKFYASLKEDLPTLYEGRLNAIRRHAEKEALDLLGGLRKDVMLEDLKKLLLIRETYKPSIEHVENGSAGDDDITLCSLYLRTHPNELTWIRQTLYDSEKFEKYLYFCSKQSNFYFREDIEAKGIKFANLQSAILTLKTASDFLL